MEEHGDTIAVGDRGGRAFKALEGDDIRNTCLERKDAGLVFTDVTK